MQRPGMQGSGTQGSGTQGLESVSTPELARCLQLFGRVDEAVQKAGVADGGAARIPGFPYLRVNRFLASFAAELTPLQEATWIAELRDLDQIARRIELSNLGDAEARSDWPAQLDECAARLVERDVLQTTRFQALRNRARVPDDYSLVARVMGFYPFAVPFLNLGIAGYQQSVRDDFARPLEDLGQGDWHLWRMGPLASESGSDDVWSSAKRVAAAPRDALGMPQLSAEDWQQLFAAHAPAFLVDTTGDFDVPGRPAWDAAGDLDFSQKPTVYLNADWTRLGEDVLPQLSYQIWFSERPAQSGLDPYSGRLDGIVWRVTLDAAGFPLVHDTVHPCGCFHSFFPVQQAQGPAPGGIYEEPLLLPQGQMPWWKIAVLIRSGDHAVQRVLPLSSGQHLAAGKVDALQTVDYDSLRQLPFGQGSEGSTRSLFQPDGLIPQSARLERYYLWPSGVPSPGTMRQGGRHATAFVGRAHFDDARLLEPIFPDRVPRPALASH
jgi:hypothetical protein